MREVTVLFSLRDFSNLSRSSKKPRAKSAVDMYIIETLSLARLCLMRRGIGYSPMISQQQHDEYSI